MTAKYRSRQTTGHHHRQHHLAQSLDKRQQWAVAGKVIWGPWLLWLYLFMCRALKIPAISFMVTSYSVHLEKPYIQWLLI